MIYKYNIRFVTITPSPYVLLPLLFTNAQQTHVKIKQFSHSFNDIQSICRNKCTTKHFSVRFLFQIHMFFSKINKQTFCSKSVIVLQLKICVLFGIFVMFILLCFFCFLSIVSNFFAMFFSNFF